MSKLHILAPGITAQWDVMSGAPCIAGRRIRVDDVVGWFLAGQRLTKIAADYELPLEYVESAVRYELQRRVRREPQFKARRTVAECARP